MYEHSHHKTSQTEHCKTVIHTSKVTDKFSHWNGQCYNHIVEQAEMRKRSILTKIKARVVDEYISVTVIVEDEYRKAQLSYEEKRAMPFPLSPALPPLPSDQQSVTLPAYQTTYDSELFLIYDKRKSAYGGRLSMFASEEQLNVLFQSDILFADGTFKVCPKLFEQLYVIVDLKNGKAVPVCFILTSNRRYESYEVLFRCLKKMAIHMGYELKPSTIVCDFERAFINAVVKELPNTAVTGCWFHFTQSCYRNIQKLRLMNLYDNDIDSRDLLCSFMGLALLPIARIQEALQILKLHVAASPHSEELKCFVSYFKSE
ncbi:unnamed protein product [Rotaria magnacalcarata]